SRHGVVEADLRHNGVNAWSNRADSNSRPARVPAAHAPDTITATSAHSKSPSTTSGMSDAQSNTSSHSGVVTASSGVTSSPIRLTRTSAPVSHAFAAMSAAMLYDVGPAPAYTMASRDFGAIDTDMQCPPLSNRMLSHPIDEWSITESTSE